VTRIVVIGVAAVLAFDVAASLLLSRLGGSLIWMFLGEGVIYLAVGFAGGRAAGIGAAMRCGAAVAALDCVVGWPIMWAIGTGQVSRLSLVAVVFVLAAMVAAGTAAGAAGALAARVVGRQPAKARAAR
jgi:hypothetical protein